MGPMEPIVRKGPKIRISKEGHPYKLYKHIESKYCSTARGVLADVGGLVRSEHGREEQTGVRACVYV